MDMGKYRHAGIDGKGPDTRNGTYLNTADDFSGSVAGVPQLTRDEEAFEKGTAALSHLCMREDGWLRIVPDIDQKVLWVKFKFSRGEHQGHYVMARVHLGDWVHGLQLVLAKVLQVDAGTRRPVKDVPYGE